MKILQSKPINAFGGINFVYQSFFPWLVFPDQPAIMFALGEKKYI